jgi:hypothetical protein
MKIRTQEYMLDSAVDNLFFSYTDDEGIVTENSNPFTQIFNVSPDSLYDILGTWRKYDVKIRIDDLTHLVDEVVPTVRDRRGYALHVSQDRDQLGLRFETREGASSLYTIPAYGYSDASFPEFSVNLSYLTKMLKVVSDWYYVVDICFSGNFTDHIVVKAKNPHEDKPDIRFALGQFSYHEGR